MDRVYYLELASNPCNPAKNDPVEIICRVF